MRLASNAAWNAARSMVGLGLGLVTSVVVARTLGPEGYGTYGYLMWLVTTGIAGLGLGMPMALLKAVPEARARGETGGPAALLRASLRRAGLISVVVGGLLAAAAFVLPLPFEPLHVALAAATIPVSVLTACYGALINGFEQYGPTTRVSLVVAVLQAAASIAVVTIGGGLGALLAVGLAGSLVSLLALRPIAARLAASGASGGPGLRPEDWSRAARYGRDAVVIALLDAVVWKRSEVVVLERTWDLRTVGLYGVAFGIAEKGMRLPLSLYGILFPTFAHVWAARGVAGVEPILMSATRLIGAVVVPIGVILAAVAGPLVSVMYGAAYAEAAPALAVVSLVSVAGGLTGVAVMALYGMGEQRVVLRRDAVGAVVNIAMNLALTPWWGLSGAVTANCVAQLVSAVVVWRHLGRRFSVIRLLSFLPRVLVASGLAAVTARLVWIEAPTRLGLALALLGAGLVYVGVLLLAGGFRRQDWRALEAGA